MKGWPGRRSCRICPFLVQANSESQVAGEDQDTGSPGEASVKWEASVKLHQHIDTDMKILMRYVLAWMGAAGIMNVYFSRSVKYLSLTTF